MIVIYIFLILRIIQSVTQSLPEQLIECIGTTRSRNMEHYVQFQNKKIFHDNNSIVLGFKKVYLEVKKKTLVCLVDRLFAEIQKIDFLFKEKKVLMRNVQINTLIFFYDSKFILF